MTAEVLAVCLDRFRRDDQAGRIGEIGQERRIGRLQLEGDRGVVVRRNSLHLREEEGQRERSGIVIGMFLVEYALEIELDRFRVKRRAVMEGDPFPELERIGLAVVGNRPALGKGRLHFQRAVLVAHKTVINVHQDAKIVDRRDRLRVQRLGLGDLADHQHIRRRLRLHRRRKRHKGRGIRRG